MIRLIVRLCGARTTGGATQPVSTMPMTMPMNAPTNT